MVFGKAGVPLIVLGLSGSPRLGGNTDLLVGEALKPFSDAGWEARFRTLSTLDIRPCVGCDGCTGAGDCRIDDGMHAVYGDMAACQAVVIGTPVYYRNVTAQLKALFDRTYAVRAVKPLAGKACGCIAVGRGSGGGQAIALTAIANYILSSGGICVPGELNGVTAVADKPGDILAQPDRLRQARALGVNVLGIAERLVR